MKIALIGHGRMGQEIENVAAGLHIEISKVFEVDDNPEGSGLTRESLKGIDVCMEFSTPSAVMDNIRAVVECGKNLVVGTTGWQDHIEEVRNLVKQKKTGFLYAPNFALGVNIFSQIVMDVARIMDRYIDYDVMIQEAHQRSKADNPSGTALALAGVVLQNLKRKTELVTSLAHGGLQAHQMQISSTRLGSVSPKHAVVFDSESDTIELVHTMKNRRGLAIGALVAAEWLKGKKGFYTMRDVLLS
jgi:4-hydroxy-tetrahydrodipicolinate reductase